MTSHIDPMQPPPFPIGAPIGQKPNGELSDKQMDALQFTYAKHLQVVGELDDATDQIAELRVKLAEAEAREKAKDEFIALLENKLNLAITDRQIIADEHAEDTVRLDMLRKILEKPPEIP